MSNPHCWKGQGLVTDVRGSAGRRDILAVFLADSASSDQVGRIFEHCGPSSIPASKLSLLTFEPPIWFPHMPSCTSLSTYSVSSPAMHFRKGVKNPRL